MTKTTTLFANNKNVQNRAQRIRELFSCKEKLSPALLVLGVAKKSNTVLVTVMWRFDLKFKHRRRKIKFLGWFPNCAWRPTANTYVAISQVIGYWQLYFTVRSARAKQNRLTRIFKGIFGRLLSPTCAGRTSKGFSSKIRAEKTELG